MRRPCFDLTIPSLSQPCINIAPAVPYYALCCRIAIIHLTASLFRNNYNTTN
jgi:hypothetical protein